MCRVQITVALFLCASLLAQDDNSKKQRKVYRTQTGSIIEAPRPIFEREAKKKKSEPRIKTLEKSKALARTKRVETTYRNELDSLKSTVSELLLQSKELQKNYEEKLSQSQSDTVFIYTTLYDTTTVKDTTFIYTSATTTNYDTVVVIDSIYINNYDTCLLYTSPSPRD